MAYKIAISSIALKGKIPAGDKRWGQFNDSFQNLELETIDIANAVYTGRSFTTWHNGRRSLDNFVLGQHLAVDMDSGDERSSFDALMNHSFVQMYASLIYTTPSHTAEQPRARVLFMLDEPITDKDAYQAAAKFLCSLFDGCDSACTDASRFFYGSLNCDLRIVDKVLPLGHLRMHFKRWQKLHPQMPVSQQPTKEPSSPNDHTESKAKPERLLEWAVEDAASQGRNCRAYRLGKQLQESGFTYVEALPVIEMYQKRVQSIKREPFTATEARKALASAFGTKELQ